VRAEHVERKLTTVLTADVAGYSRLMGADEEGTLARLKTLRRELIDPKIKEHSGRIVKTTGDGALAEFVSPVEAVRFAIEVQAGTAQRNAAVPEERRIEFRIGINLGDVIVEDHDLYGDGVNIAARLEAIAEPGGVCISRTVRDHIRDRLAYPFVDTGEQTVKNIARPIRVYALSAAAIAALPSAETTEGHAPTGSRHAGRYVVAAAAVMAVLMIGGGLWWLRSAEKAQSGTAAEIAATSALPRLSIVVLPFANLSADADQEYFAAGLTDNITTDLSRISGSFVIARNTAATYKGKTVNVKQIGAELGVRYVLEGSMQKAGTQVRVNAQLIDAQTGAHLWAERFDRDSANLLEMQDDITRRIANSLRAELIQAESDRAQREHPANPDAIDLTMRARALLNKPPSPDLIAEARRLLEQALTIDPQNGDALTGLAGTYTEDLRNDWEKPSDSDEWLRRGKDTVARALAINPRNARAYYVKAVLLTYYDLGGPIDYNQAIDAAEMAIALDPNLAPPYAQLGRLYAKVGQPERTAALVQQALRHSPRDPDTGKWLYAMGFSQLQMGHYDEAIDTFRKSATVNPNLGISWANLTAAYLGAGRDIDARKTLDEYRRLVRQNEPLPDSPDVQLLNMRVQLRLALIGRWVETVSGMFNVPAKVLLAYQRDEKLPQSGMVDEATLARLGVKASVKPDWDELAIPEQAKIGPAAGQALRLRAWLYRIPGDRRQPLIIFNHGSTDGTTAAAIFRYPVQAGIFQSMGWDVVVPMRKGRGGSDGPVLEPSDHSVPDEEQVDSAVEDLDAVVDFMRAQPYVDPARIVVAGQSRGGFLASIYAGRHPEKISGVLNFSGGWWSEDWGGEFNTRFFAEAGRETTRPMLWLYASNDPYYDSSAVRRSFAAFEAAGGKGTLFEAGEIAGSGHDLSIWPKKWQQPVAAFLASISKPP
jgi:TolB-like protein/class 3 adenylate cyclase/dienelactone hydrolase/Tfp pilus assembly protein PilF